MHPTMPLDKQPGAQSVVGRYALYDEIASGGMASVYLGRMLGPVGFTKTVAIKRLHPHLARNPEFVTMLVDEARLAARVQHPNVVATLDVVTEANEVLIVLEYVHGESLWHLLGAARGQKTRVPPHIVSAVLVNVLHGLHAAHEACDEHGRPLCVVHRDVSPQNILVGVDGVARVLDFGVAKAAIRLQSTQEGQLKGKLAYMAPEQIRGKDVDRRTDVYAAAVVLWGALVGKRLIRGKNEGEVLERVLAGCFSPPSVAVPGVPEELDLVVMRGLAADADDRFPSARDMAMALERACPPASPFEVTEWVKSVAAEALALRTARVRDMESSSEVRVSMQDGNVPMVVAGRESHAVAAQSGVTRPLYAPTSYAHSAAFEDTPVRPVVSPPMPAPQAYAMPMHSPMPMAPRVAEPPRSTSGVRLGLVAMVGFVILLGLALIVLLRMPEFATTRSSAGEATPIVSAPPIVPPVKVAPPLPSPPSTFRVSDLPAAVPSSDQAPTARPSALSKPPARAAKPVSCDPPFYVDSDDIKHVKPECM